MKRQILLVGIGQTGCTVADVFCEKINTDAFSVSALAIDTDERTLDALENREKISLTDERSLDAVVDRLGEDNITKWFPCAKTDGAAEFIRSLRMNVGANQWRMKAFLSFCAYMNDEAKSAHLKEALDRVIENCKTESSCEPITVYTVASLAGGTGSALFLPLALYIKKYLSDAGCAEIFSHALLTMPEIYENSYGAEQRVKSYANTYAALRELNAVNITCFSSKEELLAHPPVDFKIGCDGVLDTLFDCSNESFNSPAAAPFNEISLFQRVPAVNSVKTHANIIADIICSLCHDEENTGRARSNTKNPIAVYSGISLVKVLYPYGSIVEYITKKQVQTLVDSEFGKLHAAVKNGIAQHCASMIAYGHTPKSDTSLYCDIFTSIAEEILDESGVDGIIGRINEDKRRSAINPNKLWDVSCLDGLDAELDASLACESAERIMRESVNMSNDKKKKGAARKEMIELVEDMSEHLNIYYKNALRALSEGRDEFISSMLSEGEESVFSPARDLLSLDGARLHPTYALLRLCLAYKVVKSRIKCKVEAELPDYTTARIPASFLVLDEIEKPLSKYAKLGADRFVTLCQSANAKLADDEGAIRVDIGAIYAKMVEYFRSVRYLSVLNLLESMINSYRAVFEALYSHRDDIASDVRLAAVYGSADSANVIHVGADVKQKTKLADAYIELYYENTETLASVDRRMGELVFGLIQSKLDPLAEDGGDSALGYMLGGAENIFRTLVTDSEFFKKNIRRSLIEVILHPDPLATKASPRANARLFSGRYIPLRTGVFGTHEQRRAITTSTTAILPFSAREYLENNVCAASGDTPESFVEKLMYTAGEYHGRSAFSAHPNEFEMYVRKEISNIPLHLVEAANELSVECKPYINYTKALKVAKDQMTQMWNPALTRSGEDELPLPAIDPSLRTAYEQSVAKALMLAMYREDLSLTENADHVQIYVAREDTEKKPITRNGDNIEASNVRELFLWAFARPEWCEEYANAYDRLLASDVRRVPALDLCDYNRANVIRAYKRAGTVECNCASLFKLIVPLLESEHEDRDGYAYTFVSVADQTLRALSLDNNNMSVELASEVYNSLLDLLFSSLVNQESAEMAQKIVSALNAKEFLRSFKAPRDFGDYVIDQTTLSATTDSDIPDDIQ